VNGKELREWAAAVGACLEGVDAAPLTAVAAAFEAAAPGRWEVSVSGRGPAFVGLRFFGGDGYARWREACAKAFGVAAAAGPHAPSAGFPWAQAAWDLRAGRWTALRLCGAAAGEAPRAGETLAWDHAPGAGAAAPRRLRPRPWKGRAFGDAALDRALDDFARLCPPRALAVAEPGWSLTLASPPRWPAFARCELSAAFTPGSSQLALFLLDRRVTELSFDGEALWAHCAG
jgi:hypothetical protein